jgi:thiamine kinase-like enzyme
VVHGDFVGKNVRLRERAGEVAVLVFDWEVAGWGPPGVDLARFAADRHHEAMSAYCGAAGVSPAAAWRNAELGVVFRLLAAIDWIAVELCLPEHPVSDAYPAWLQHEPLGNLALFRQWMEPALIALES